MKTESFPHELLEDTLELSSYCGWSEEVYEDIARANETLLTESAFDALKERTDINFQLQASDDQLFPFYRAIKRDQ